jgi:hypothetical protein
LVRGVSKRASMVFASALGASAAVSAVVDSLGFGLGRCIQPVFLSRVDVCSPSYSQGGELSTAIAIFFSAALIVSISPRAALLTSFALLNLLFAWTSRLLEAISQALGLAVSRLVSMVNVVFWGGLGLGRLTQYSQAGTDLVGLSLLALLVSLILVMNRAGGVEKAIARGLRAAALCLVLLGVEVAAFDPGELYRHVTAVQVLLNFLPWFSNADLLLSAASVVVVSSALLRLHRVGQGQGRPPSTRRPSLS